MSEKTTRAILPERSGGMCERCGINPAQSIHHRRKRGQGGPWTPTNCLHLCGDGTRGCHGWAESHPTLAREIGVHVRAFEDEADIPVRWFGTAKYLWMDGSVSDSPERSGETDG